MFYTKYRGRSIGRILGYLERMTTLRIVEEAIVKNNSIEYYGEIIATYEWISDTDIALIKFKDPMYQRAYDIQIPYHDWEIQFPNLNYIVQELARYQKYDLTPPHLQKRMIKKWTFGLLTDEQIEEVYPHLAEVARKIY